MPDKVNILEQHEERPRSAKIISALIEGAILVLALVLAFVIRTAWLETAIVTSGSMKPTLSVGARLLVDHRDTLHNHWQRGDIVIFRAPKHWPQQAPNTYVKRIIAIPGDTFQMVNGKVYINGKVLSEPYLPQKPLPENYGPWTMAGSQYFMMGDNRNDSEDSRDHGPVPDKDIRGKVFFEIWPLSGWGSID